jgi:hypothetical protein
MSIIEGSSPGNRALVERVKAILTKPKTEWLVIDAEPATVQGLYIGYACILAAIPAVCGLIGGQVFGYGAFGITVRPPLIGAVVGAIVSYVLNLAMIYVLALIADALAPSFDGQKSQIQALKVSVYAATASWIGGVFTIFPPLAILGVLMGFYSLYLLYLGLPVLMKAPESKALGYTAVVVVVAIVLSIVIGTVVGGISAMGALGSGFAFGNHAPASGGTISGTVNVPGGGSVDLGKLQAASKQMEAAAKQMEASANGSSGGVQPVAAEVLQALLPAGVAGYTRGDVSSSSGGAAGLSGSQAEAEYTKGDQRFRLEVTDMGGAAGFAALAGSFNVQSNKTTSTGYEKVGKVNGRMTTEEWDNSSKDGKYGVMVADRFMVQAEGTGASMNELKGAVSAVNFGALEKLAKS